jgi:hypothetical protein
VRTGGDTVNEAPSVEQPTDTLLSWILLSGFFVIAHVAQAVYLSHGVEPSPRFRVLALIGTYFLSWYWFTQQLEPRNPKLPMDVGAFILALWFILMPYYLWHYERWRGLLKALGLGAVYFLAWGLGIVVELALR